MEDAEKICVCGESEGDHVDCDGPCVISDCGCREFEERATEAEKLEDAKTDNYDTK